MAKRRSLGSYRKLMVALGLDPRAVMAVAAQEGLGGGIGDAGHAYGPWQLNNAGGVITRTHPGTNDPRIQNWAWSPAGIRWALTQMAPVAKGLKGGAAITNLVKRFERPSDIPKEIAGALATYRRGNLPRGFSGSVPPIPISPSFSAPNEGYDALAAIRAIESGDLTGLASALGGPARRSVRPSKPFTAPTPTPGAPNLPGVAPAELLREGVGGPTHSTGPHIHVAYTNPQAMLRAISLAQSLGLHVGENPYVGDVVDPVHAPHSYHYRTFPGRYHGRRLGEAIDVSGDPASTNRFYLNLARSRSRG